MIVLARLAVMVSLAVGMMGATAAVKGCSSSTVQSLIVSSAAADVRRPKISVPERPKPPVEVRGTDESKPKPMSIWGIIARSAVVTFAVQALRIGVTAATGLPF